MAKKNDTVLMETFSNVNLVSSSDLHENTLRFITRHMNGRLEFVPEVQSRWTRLGRLWRDDWFNVVDMKGDPCASVVAYDEKMEEVYAFVRARLLVYYFLVALMHQPINEDEKKDRKKYHLVCSQKIQMCFVKFLCYVAARSTGPNLDLVDVDIKLIVFVGRVERENQYMAGCILCPKMDRRSIKYSMNGAACNAISRFQTNHLRSKKHTYGRVCQSREMNRSHVMSVPLFLIQIQRTIARLSRVLGRQCLNVKDLPYSRFKKTV